MFASEGSSVAFAGNTRFDTNRAGVDAGETSGISHDILVFSDNRYTHKTFKYARTVVTIRRLFRDVLGFMMLAGLASVLIPHAFRWSRVTTGV